MNNVAVIVQARMTSTRLPGKVLNELNGYSILAHVLHRCSAIADADIVCCAIPDSGVHDVIVDEAKNYNTVVTRGSEDDVLERYYQTAKALDVSVIMRVTSDCPLIDPELCNQVLSLVLNGKAEYACNNMPASWPHGLDCEAFTMEALEQAALQAKDPFERKHVTPWLRANTKLIKRNYPAPEKFQSHYRWTVDFPEDLLFFQKLFELLPHLPEIPTTDYVIEILQKHPEICCINEMHQNVSRPSVP